MVEIQREILAAFPGQEVDLLNIHDGLNLGAMSELTKT